MHNRVYSRTHRISDPLLKCITILMDAVIRMVITMMVLFMVIALGCNPTGPCSTCMSGGDGQEVVEIYSGVVVGDLDRMGRMEVITAMHT